MKFCFGRRLLARSALPVLMDFHVHCAPVLERTTIRQTAANFEREPIPAGEMHQRRKPCSDA